MKHHISDILSHYEHSVQFYASKSPKKYIKTHSLLNNVSYRKGGNIKCFNKLQIPLNSSSNFYLSFSSRSKSLSKLCYLTACESISEPTSTITFYVFTCLFPQTIGWNQREIFREEYCAQTVSESLRSRSLFVTRKTRLLRWKNILFLVFSSFIFYWLKVFTINSSHGIINKFIDVISWRVK